MKLEQFTHIYLLGIGGIGMSALARYFMANNCAVAGYDRTSSSLIEMLQKEGASIRFEDNIKQVPKEYLNIETTLVIYTPAIPKAHSELNFFKANGYHLLKRSQVLGLVSLGKNCLAIAGTHGKTTVSSMTAHILNEGERGCTAFLGGITNNYNSNLILNESSNTMVVEADEFDRSFLQLSPNIALITSMDADHLDIYDTHQGLHKSFQDFVDLLPSSGKLIIKKGLEQYINTKRETFTYSLEHMDADFKILNLKLENGEYNFSIQGPNLQIDDISLGMPGRLNIENALAASAISFLNGEKPEIIKKALASFKGVKRRMEYIIKRKDLIYLDDYAHHPEELKASITSVKALYPNLKVCGIFQPHLYSRTRDFLEGFAKSLALLDQVILLEIYPAREEAIPGINSQLLLDKIPIKNKTLLQKEDLISYLKSSKQEVIITLGAGDIDRLVETIKKAFA